VPRLDGSFPLWEVWYAPCPTCDWEYYDQTVAQYIRDEYACQCCGTVVPVRILWLSDEHRVLYGAGGELDEGNTKAR